MKVFTALILVMITGNVFAGSSAIVIAYGTGNVPVNSSIDIDAEYVALSVTVSSDSKYASERANLINKFQTLISNKASNIPNIEFQQGVISLSPREKSSFSLSRSYGRNTGSGFYLLSKLEADKDIFEATQNIYAFIKNIKIPDDTNLRLGETSLAISTPSKYRNQLIVKVKDEINETKSIIGPEFKVSITGLENPVIVKQKDDKQVTVFLDYRFTLMESK